MYVCVLANSGYTCTFKILLIKAVLANKASELTKFTTGMPLVKVSVKAICAFPVKSNWTNTLPVQTFIFRLSPFNVGIFWLSVFS